MIRKIALTFLIQILCISLSFAANKMASAQFLKLGLGARAVAMGSAYTGVSDEINAIYWNPAGLTQIKGNAELTLMHALWFQDISFDYAAYCHEGFGGVLGIGVNYLGSGNINKYDISGNALNQTYSATDMNTCLTYAKKFGVVSFGLNLKQVASKIEDEQSSSLVGDLGVFFSLFNNINIGLAAQNYGGEVKFRNEIEELPKILRFGCAYKMENFILDVDLVSSSDEDADIHAGIEYVPGFITRNFAIRAGYKTKASANFEALAGVTAGFGLKISKYTLDYAMDTFGDLGYTHMVSLGLKFGLPEEEAEAPAPAVSKKEETKQGTAEKDIKGKQLNVAVLDFQALAPISMSEATFTTEIFRSSLVKSKRYKIVDRNNMEKVLAEQGLQQTGCTSNECAVKMGKLLNVNKIVSGTFGKLGAHYLLTISVLDVETSEIIYSDKAFCKELTPDQVQLMTDGLLQRLLKEVK
ncbi:MAG: PorV/PorQ family protein [Elusimicrobia bacterium]|nr:PorV/PorQ family protein [Candidatus Liberimonas magnetica]